MSKNRAYGICIYKIEEDETVKILLCKSIKSKDKWGFLKGLVLRYEESKRCAQREFFEESSIFVEMDVFEEYFEQTNDEKDVGIWLVNANNVPDLDDYFYEDRLATNYLSWENSKVKFFDIKKLPKIRKKQKQIAKAIKSSLKSKSQHH